jgi:hypothetical protein
MKYSFLKIMTFFLLISSLFSGQTLLANERCLTPPPNGLVMPKKGTTGAHEIGIGIEPHSLTKFNTKEGTAEIDFYYTIEYELAEPLEDLKCVGNDAKSVWDIFYNPSIEFFSISNPVEGQGFHWLIENNRFVYLTRINGTIVLDGDFRLFPFDNVNASIKMAAGEDDRKILLKPSLWYMPEYPNISKEISKIRIVSGWSLVDAKFVNVKYPWRFGRFGDGLDFRIEVDRKPLPFLVRAGLPLSLIFIIALTTRYALMGSKDTQMGILSGLLLSIFAYSIYLNEQIPETEYLTFADFMWIGVLASVSLITFGQMLFERSNSNNLIMKIEKSSAFVAIIIYISTVIITGFLIIFRDAF